MSVTNRYIVLVETEKDGGKEYVGSFYDDELPKNPPGPIVAKPDNSDESHLVRGTRKVLNEVEYDVDDLYRAHLFRVGGEHMLLRSEEDGEPSLEPALGDFNPPKGG